MSIAKLKLDLSNGTLDIEADEELVKKIYEDFKLNLTSHQHNPDVQKPKGLQENSLNTGATAHENKKGQKEQRKTKKTSRFESFSVDNEVDTKKLKDFFEEKSPITQYETNAVFIYFLKKINNIESVDLDHVYTCYKGVNKKVPKALRQSLVDTAHDRAYIVTKDLSNILLTIVGENFVEHDLPKKISDK